jgi:hypothetical protein
MKRLSYILLILAFASFSFASSQQTSTTTAAAIIDRAEVYLNDANNRMWSAGELLTWLNDGMVDIVSRTHCLETTEDISLTSNTLEYSVTSTYTTVKSVLYVDEKVTNGTMEANSNWTAVAGASPHEQSTTQKNAGTYSWKFTVDAADEGTKSDTFTTEDDVLYFYKAYVYPDDTTTVNVYVISGDGSTELLDTDVTGLTENAFNLVSGSFTETVGGSSAYIAFRSVAAGGGTDTWYIDDVTINSMSKGLIKGKPSSVGNVDDVGQPVYWYDWAGSIGVYPTLTDVSAEKITLYLITRPTAIAASANVTTPMIYDTALVLYMCAQAWLKDLKPTKYLQMMALYDAELRRIRQDLNEQPQISE